MAIDWTPDRVKTLMALWAEGISTLEIGRRLGVTKNSVVGKVHRLGLPKRQSPINSSTRTPRASKSTEPVRIKPKKSTNYCRYGEDGRFDRRNVQLARGRTRP